MIWNLRSQNIESLSDFQNCLETKSLLPVLFRTFFVGVFTFYKVTHFLVDQLPIICFN